MVPNFLDGGFGHTELVYPVPNNFQGAIDRFLHLFPEIFNNFSPAAKLPGAKVAGKVRSGTFQFGHKRIDEVFIPFGGHFFGVIQRIFKALILIFG